MGVEHYENFPVASLLCPARLRPPVQAIYHFARTADDLADEGDVGAAQRLAALQAFRAELHRAARGEPSATAWPKVFGPLADALRRFRLPLGLLEELLDAFEQDVRNPPYPDRTALLDYCRRSANPVGRLLLHLYGVDDARSLAQSDAICTALQLVNMWQDLGRDIGRQRVYVPLDEALRHGVDAAMLRCGVDTPQTRALVAALTAWAVELMQRGAPLAGRLPGRIGWELRFVVQGGLRVAERIAALGHATLRQRPVLGVFDAPSIAWRAATMGWARSSAGVAA